MRPARAGRWLKRRVVAQPSGCGQKLITGQEACTTLGARVASAVEARENWIFPAASPRLPGQTGADVMTVADELEKRSAVKKAATSAVSGSNGQLPSAEREAAIGRLRRIKNLYKKK